MIRFSSSPSWAALLLLGAALLPSTSRAANSFTLKSPDSRTTVTVGTDRSGHLNYSVQFGKQTVLNASALGLWIDGQDIGQSATLGQATLYATNENYTTRGVHSTATNHYQEADIPITGGPTKTDWTLEVRVFNYGVAYRYHVPGQAAKPQHVESEDSEWRLPSGCTIWYQANVNEYEGPYVEAKSDDLLLGTRMGAPVAVRLPRHSGYALMTEANLINFSDMALESSDKNCYKAFFHADLPGWTAKGDIYSPWRVTLLSPDLNGLVNSDAIRDLCPPPPTELANADWIRPGRTSWGWLVSGHPKLDDQKSWIDATKRAGFEYYLIDDGWKIWVDGTKDAWGCLKDVVDYAHSQGVKILIWVASSEVATPETRIPYFGRAQSAGVSGLKIDFPQPADTQWVNWYDDTLRDAATFHFVVDFHGAVKPTGRDRTWPNELTREAIRGRENGPSLPADSATLPFTRYVQGNADYTPTMFYPGRLGASTWGHELAQAIVYTSPLLCYADHPDVYLSNPAADVLQAIPSTWDETVVLPGSEIGQVAAFARRKGDQWFIGVVNGPAPQKLDIDLRFLVNGSYHIVRLADAPDRPDGWSRSESVVTAKDRVSVEVRPGGGFVAWLKR